MTAPFCHILIEGLKITLMLRALCLISYQSSPLSTGSFRFNEYRVLMQISAWQRYQTTDEKIKPQMLMSGRHVQTFCRWLKWSRLVLESSGFHRISALFIYLAASQGEHEKHLNYHRSFSFHIPFLTSACTIFFKFGHCLVLRSLTGC